MSWILEVRAKLAEPATQRLDGEAESRFAVLLPLYVDAGELWTLLAEGEDGASIFHGDTVPTEGSPWETARQAASRLGVQPASALKLGELDELGSPKDRLTTWVAAVPTPTGPLPDGLFALPLRAVAMPSLVEEREGPGGVPLKVVHVGRRRIWGVPLWLLEMLMTRLGLLGGE